jgi:hypothetical protein
LHELDGNVVPTKLENTTRDGFEKNVISDYTHIKLDGISVKGENGDLLYP